MPTTSHKIFVNLAVADLERSVEFFTKLGFSFDQRFTDENATAMIVNDDASVMLLTEDFFAGFTSKRLCDPTSSTEAIVALSAESRAEVDELVTTALEAGGQPANEKMDQGPMYAWSFADPDGHLWEVIHMDPSAFAG